MNVICRKDILNLSKSVICANDQAMSLDQLASKFMGKNVPCFATVNGNEIIDEWHIQVDGNDIVEFQIIEPFGGDDDGGGKQILSTLASVAVLAASAYLAPIAGVALSSASGGLLSVSVATQVAQASLMFVGNLAVSAAFQPQAQAPKEQYKSISPQNNVARIGQPIPEVFGSFVVFADLAITPYHGWVANDPFLEEWFHPTNGQAELSQYKLGRVPISDFSDVVVNKHQDAYLPMRYPVPDANGVELFAPQDEDLSSWTDGTGWSQWFELCPPYETLGNVVGGSRFEISINFPKGILDFKQVDEGSDEGEHNIFLDGFLIEIQRIDDQGFDVGNAVKKKLRVPVPPSKVKRRENYTATIIFMKNYYNAILGTGRLDAGEMAWPEEFLNERVKIRIKRTANRDSDLQDASTAKIASLYGLGIITKPLKGVSAELKAGQMKRLPNGGAQTFNVMVKRKIHTFKKVGSSYQYDALRFENSAAQIMFHLFYELLNKDGEIPFSELAKKIDLITLWDLHLGCLLRNERFNGVIKQEKSFWDVATQIGFCMRVKPIRRGQKISFIRDEAPAISNSLITPYHIVKGGFSVEYRFESSHDVHDGVQLDYVEMKLLKHNSVFAKIKGSGRPTNPLIVDAQGVTNYGQAQKLANFMAKAMRYRKNQVSVTIGKEWQNYNVGDVVRFSHNIVDGCISASIEKADDKILHLDKSVSTNLNKAIIRMGEAKSSQMIDCVIASDGKSVILSELPKIAGQVEPITDFEQSGDPDVVTLFSEDQDEPQMMRVTDISGGKKTGTLTGYVEDMRVYGDN